MARTWEYGQLYESNPEIFGGRPRTGINLLKINKAGEEGWELVGMTPFTSAQGEVLGAFYFFKRPVE
jgi:hypothetical protein